MSKIKVTELFYSLQGEGKFTGVPSVFLRVFGCNFTCSGFNMESGLISDERHTIDPTKYSSLKELPLVSTGCDSYASWDPRFKKFSKDYTIEELSDEIQKLLPNGKFSTDVHLVITGGEPLLGRPRQLFYIDLINYLEEHLGLTDVTFETNATQVLCDELSSFLMCKLVDTTFSMSPKLPCSGEPWNNCILPDVVSTYKPYRSGISHYFKFVVGSEEDIKYVDRAVELYRKAALRFPVYLMPVGGTDIVYNGKKTTIAELCLQKGYRYSPRLHIDLFGNKWGT